MSDQNTSLYARIGGEEGIETLVDVFYDRILADPELSPFFAHTGTSRLRSMQKEFFSEALGGPLFYSGRSLREVHAGRGIKKSHLRRFTGHLMAALEFATRPVFRIPNPSPACHPVRQTPQPMDFKAPFTTFFDHPQWKNNWLLVTVCTLIPVIGPMVITGWILRCFAAWLDERPAPAFDFQYFAEYLKQGLWPTLVSMVLMLVAMIFIMPLSLGAIFAVVPILEGGSDGAGVVIALAVVALIILLELLLFAVAGIIVTPAILHSGLRQDFASGFSLKFILDFLKRCWGPLLLTQLALIVMWIAAIVIGYLALFIGVYFTVSLMTCVQWHLHYQVYRTYLARGGAEIPLHPALRPVLPPPLGASPAPPRLPA